MSLGSEFVSTIAEYRDTQAVSFANSDILFHHIDDEKG
jgi:hypothetical protein